MCVNERSHKLIGRTVEVKELIANATWRPMVQKGVTHRPLGRLGHVDPGPGGVQTAMASNAWSRRCPLSGARR